MPGAREPGASDRRGAGDGFEAFLQNDLQKDLLRFSTAGSVDDGKSTLIGRLLHDSQAVYEDQLAAVRRSRINRSGKAVDFSLLTDGLRAEREQGITIDVAYRYFSTARRKFIIADTPGHEEYTRNMATGASTADLAVILVDATKGLLPQTRRHAYIASLLGIPQVVAAINKMDLASYREDRFHELQRGFRELARALHIAAVDCIPVSALEGDNVVTRGANMPWYAGPTLLEFLETVEIRRADTQGAFRFPVQYVIRPDAHFRGFAGRVAGSAVRPGDEVLALPSMRRTTVRSVVGYSGDLDAATSPQSIVLQLADEIDLSRGDMLVAAEAPPRAASHFAAMMVWLNAEPLALNRKYLLKHAARQVHVKVCAIRFRVNIDDLTHVPAESLEMNGIAAVELETHQAIFFDPYHQNRTTGSFILIDPLSNATLGAGMILEEAPALSGALSGPPAPSPHEPKLLSAVAAEERAQRRGHRPGLLFVDATAGDTVERALFEEHFDVVQVRADAVPPEALWPVFSAVWSAGLLIVCSGENARPQARALAESAGGFFFDLADTRAPHAHRDVVRAALEAANELCLPPGSPQIRSQGVRRNERVEQPGKP